MKKLLLVLFTFQLNILSQVPFNLQPDWVSADLSGVATGGAWADINNDGWLDLVVANGNDIERQKLAVYLNNGSGSLPLTPSWESADIDYHGHLDVGDINKDGFIDVVVSVYIGAAGFSQKGKIKMYLNNNGILSSTPSWTSADDFYTFSCALGDADGDGDLDLAAAGGESYYNRSEKNRIYYNNNGVLSSLPGWMSLSAGYAYDVEWADIDNDGDLDLIFAEEKGPNKLFLNYGDSIGTVPVWQSADPSLYANSLFIKDVNNDFYLDLAVSDNNQLGGSGKFKIYLNNNGILSTTPYWTSAFSGYGSGITLGDIDNDGDNDLITGGWWQPCRIYLNSGGTFPQTPNWTSTSSSVVEAIFLGDLDNDHLIRDSAAYISNGIQKLFYLPKSPVHKIVGITFDNSPVGYAEYCFDMENGWISFSSVPAMGSWIKIVYDYSRDLDIGVTNWDSNKGNYVFINNSIVPVELTSFTAEAENNTVHLEWVTATETNNLGFEIHRKTPETDWITIAFKEGAGSTIEQQNYNYTDQELQNGKYIYRLKQIDLNGEYSFSPEVEIEISTVFSFKLEQNYPNPFNPSTRIRYTVASGQSVNVQLKIYDILGNEIAVLVNEIKPEGEYEAEFRSRSTTPSGIYFYKMTAGAFSRTVKMTLIK
jgi:hypothetical protein